MLQTSKKSDEKRLKKAAVKVSAKYRERIRKF